ncbi:hypothetical protein BTVI_48090 [Pitangus sulphuratus]|nr:hypothetical protein BTVI_48090 [Pitangus sulphuratus]
MAEQGGLMVIVQLKVKLKSEVPDLGGREGKQTVSVCPQLLGELRLSKEQGAAQEQSGASGCVHRKHVPSVAALGTPLQAVVGEDLDPKRVPLESSPRRPRKEPGGHRVPPTPRMVLIPNGADPKTCLGQAY